MPRTYELGRLAGASPSVFSHHADDHRLRHPRQTTGTGGYRGSGQRLGYRRVGPGIDGLHRSNHPGRKIDKRAGQRVPGGCCRCRLSMVSLSPQQRRLRCVTSTGLRFEQCPKTSATNYEAILDGAHFHGRLVRTNPIGVSGRDRPMTPGCVLPSAYTPTQGLPLTWRPSATPCRNRRIRTAFRRAAVLSENVVPFPREMRTPTRSR